MMVLDYEADIASDLSAFHRIDDVDEMDGPTYFSRAARLPAYNGVMAARAYAEQHRDEAPAHGAPAANAAPSRVSDSTALAMLAGEWAEHVVEEDAE